MRFRSTHATLPLSFECGGTQYDVPVGGSCEIPDRFAYAVKAMGLALAPDPEPAAPTEPAAQATEPDPEPAERSQKKR